MAISDKELAFFGGWTRRVVAGGDHDWGSPMLRVMEMAPSAVSNLFLPQDSPWLCRGVPYWVVNTGSANLTVKRPSDGATVYTLTPGVAGMFIYGATWFGRAIGTAQFGTASPGLHYEIEIAANEANVNLLQRVIARGYDGTAIAAVTVRVQTLVAVGSSSQAGFSLWTGNTVGGISWFAGSYWVLVVDAGAGVGGWGGFGGNGGIPSVGASANGSPGGAGGRAIRTEIPMRVDCQGSIFAGGGGGGGGASGTGGSICGGGGGGGRGMNMAPGGSGPGSLIGSTGGTATNPAAPGLPGGPAAPGYAGPGTTGGGNGGAGGDAGVAGSAGVGSVSGATGGAAGAAGIAISYLPAAGAPTILAGGANIIGPIVSEA